jgi:hypothetical protein
MQEAYHRQDDRAGSEETHAAVGLAQILGDAGWLVAWQTDGENSSHPAFNY